MLREAERSGPSQDPLEPAPQASERGLVAITDLFGGPRRLSHVTGGAAASSL